MLRIPSDFSSVIFLHLTDCFFFFFLRGNGIQRGELDRRTAMQQMMYAQMAHRGGSSWDPAFSKDWDQTKASDLCLAGSPVTCTVSTPIPFRLVFSEICCNFVCTLDILMAIFLLIFRALWCTQMKTMWRGCTRSSRVPRAPRMTVGSSSFSYVVHRITPISSPRVKLLTTGGGQVRFNPNLYANGKVCLSLLG